MKRKTKISTMRGRATQWLPLGILAAAAAGPSDGATALVAPAQAAPQRAATEANVITRVAVASEGQKTTVTLHGSAVASFTAYRLAQPPRLVEMWRMMTRQDR